jgi:hypothetical protein
MAMVIERSGFLLAATALAAGGLGGWLARDKSSPTPTADVPPASAAPAPSPAPVVAVEHVPPPPVCDDSIGIVEDCPATGPSDEGFCNLAAKRCNEFKLAFKPKVAQAAVACLKRLKGQELCDQARVNLCGHTALMAACQDPSAALAAADAGAPHATSLVTASCEGIVKGCAGEPTAPTMSDCRQTLSGMSDTGRANMMACVSTHCRDRALLGCEGKKELL